jgi:hypothetical protein
MPVLISKRYERPILSILWRTHYLRDRQWVVQDEQPFAATAPASANPLTTAVLPSHSGDMVRPGGQTASGAGRTPLIYHPH